MSDSKHDIPMAESSEPTSAVLSLFQEYSSELDEHYDRRERIIKTSRDITALSKKLIFHLHRVTQRKPAAVLKEAQPKLEELSKLFDSLQDDLAGERYWRYQRQISPGVQEYVSLSRAFPLQPATLRALLCPDRGSYLYALSVFRLYSHDH
jgi:hypothetical protein